MVFKFKHIIINFSDGLLCQETIVYCQGGGNLIIIYTFDSVTLLKSAYKIIACILPAFPLIHPKQNNKWFLLFLIQNCHWVGGNFFLDITLII